MEANKEKIVVKSSKISQQNHIIEESGENGKIQYNCTACRKTFRSRSQKYYHINCNQLQNFAYKCQYCDKCFTRQAQWKYHIESHISPVNECRKCQKTFSNPLALKKHIALHEVEPKSCPQCDKTFKKKISLDQHIAAQHLNQLQYGCAYCSKKYASKSSLQLHLQTHEGKRFDCQFCGKVFQRNSILNLHLKRHYNKNCYICAVCQKVFSESGTLARHRKIHEESVPQYYCKLCEKSILRKDNMTRHLITIHPEENFDNIVKIIKPSIKLHETVENEESNLCNSKQEYTKKSPNHILVIENKLLNEPFEWKESITDIPNNYTTKVDTVEYPLTNQIKVITAVPRYKKEIFTPNIEDTSGEIIKQCNKANHQQQKDSLEIKNLEVCHENSVRTGANYDFITVENIAGKQNNTNAANITFVNHTQLDSNKLRIHTDQKELNKNQDCFHTCKSESKTTDNANLNRQHELPIPQSFSSVIRSVGNVKKSLTSHIVTPAKAINNISVEYKHKKYCRNHYNIDLYRKILGCDEDDYDEEEKQQKFDDMRKSSTPVHWRKCFKNNYETLES